MERVLREAWQVGIGRSVGSEAGAGIGEANLSTVADRQLAELVACVEAAEGPHELFAACLDRFSRRLGRGGDYFTPRGVSRLMVAVADPRGGERILDPVCGSAGLLVDAARAAGTRSSDGGRVRLHGRDVNVEARLVAAMNLALHSLEADLGPSAVDSLLTGPTRVGCDVVLANPPFGTKSWGHDALAADERWRWGTPPPGNADFAWIQHVLAELCDRGRAVVLLGDGAAKSVRTGEREIRGHLVGSDMVAAVVALPAHLFPHSPVSACLWFLSRDKRAHPRWGRTGRTDQILFVNARALERRDGKGRRSLGDADIERVRRTFSMWRGSDADSGAGALSDVEEYADESGWCRSVSRREVEAAGWDLSPALHVPPRAEASEGTDAPAALRNALYGHFADASSLDRTLRRVLGNA
ncbi:N-6 DNA methylase [Embleya scabrispora]|nr:N-6 DNA methylase [Embleya scabrispora]